VLIPIILYAAAYFSLITAGAVFLRDRRSFIHRAFAAGMLLLAVEDLLRGIGYTAISADEVIFWQKLALAVSAAAPAIWIAFSVSYGRIGSGELVAKWKTLLIATGSVPLMFGLVFNQSLFLNSIYLQDAGRWLIPLDWAGRALQFFFLLTSILIVFNLERTIRSSTGRMRWQIKFMALGVGGLFALRVYLASQSLLFTTLDTGFGTVDALALLAANLLFAISLSRGPSLNVDVYLSTAAIQGSLTILTAGIYLLVVGILSHFARFSPANTLLPLDTFIVFVSLTALAVLLLSNRLRRRLRLFISRHLNRPIYDYRSVWMQVTERTTSLVDAKELSTAVCRMVSELVEILSVSVWLVDESQRRLMLAGSTSISGSRIAEMDKPRKSAHEFIRFMAQHPECVDFEETQLEWPSEIMQVAPEFFAEHKLRYAVALEAGRELVGVMTLDDDRVGGERRLSAEEFALLETVAGQLAAGLLNLRLSERLQHAKEVEAFQTVATFFVHDLKNLASRLSLTMQNFSANFENEEFRRDMLRMIATSLTKIDEMCERLAMLRQNIELKLERCDLNQLVSATLDEFKGNLRGKLNTDLKPLPKTLIDPQQIHNVLTNLVMNANEAVNGNGVIHVATAHEGETVCVSVGDNGCGMSQHFIEKSLFRPFQTTKKRGLGIGLFQSRLIVEAHRGAVEVNSTVGKGTEFRIVLPIA